MKQLVYRLILVMGISLGSILVSTAQSIPSITSAGFSAKTVNQNSTIDFTIEFSIVGFDPIPHLYTDEGTSKSTYILTVDFPVDGEILPVEDTPGAGLINDSGDFFTWTYDEDNNSFFGKPKRVLQPGESTSIKITLMGMKERNTPYNINSLVQVFGLMNTPTSQLSNTLLVEAPLPVTLTHFTATKEQSTTALTWATSDEVGSDRFVVQRSFDHKDWHDLGTVYAAGNSKTEREYSFIDQAPLNGDNYYRLKMIDRDGSYEMSRIASVVFDNLSTIAVYPNPTTEAVRVISREKQPISKLVLQGTAGEHILTRTSDLEKQIDLKSMPGGTYILQIHHTDGQISSHKIIKL